MKNLMLGLAVVALCGSAVAGTTVTSSKTVGYRNTATVEGYTLATPTFINTAKTAISIADVTVIGGTSGAVQMKTLATTGKFADTYTWYTKDEAGHTADGWYGKDAALNTTLTFAAGAGFVISSSAAGAKIHIKGLVDSSVKSIALAQGYSIVGNPLNKTVNLQSIKLTGDKVSAYVDQLQFIAANGSVSQVCYWLTDDAIGTGKAGWYDKNWNAISNVNVPAGSTFMCYTKNGATLVLAE